MLPAPWAWSCEEDSGQTGNALSQGFSPKPAGRGDQHPGRDRQLKRRALETGQVPEALPLMPSGCDDGSDLTIRGAELVPREMGGAFIFSCRKPPWGLLKHGTSSHCLGQDWLRWLAFFSRGGCVHTSMAATDSREQRQE